MRSFQLFMELANQSTQKNEIDEAASDAAAFKERQKAKQSASLSTAKSRASKYKEHGVTGAGKKGQKAIARRNRATARAAGQLGSAALSIVRRGVSKVKSSLQKEKG